MKFALRGAAALAVALVLSQVPGHAQNGQTSETITFAGTSIGFTATTIRPDGLPVMTVCYGRLETAEIRVRTDGSPAVASTSGGIPTEVGDFIVIVGLDKLTAFRGIRTTATSGSVYFQCSR